MARDVDAVAVVGVGMSAFRTRRDDTDLFGLMQEVTDEALGDAGCSMDDIDGVVFSEAPDALHGIGHPEQLAVAALGSTDRPVLRAHTGGLTGMSAAQLGWWMVASGRFERVLVVGADKMGDAQQPAQLALNEIWDPAYESSLPLNAISMCAMSVVRYMHRHGATVEQFATIAARLRANGADADRAHLRRAVSPREVLEEPFICWPITRAMACPQSSGGCAVVLANRDRADAMAGPKAWVRGVACRTNTYFMGDKMGDAGENDHGAAFELRLAAREAYAMAGIDDPASVINVAEPYVPFSPMEPPVLESLRLAEPGTAARLAEEGVWNLDGRLPVNPSGIPLWMGAIEDAGVRRAAANGDAWVMPPGSQLDKLRRQLSLFRDAREQAMLQPAAEQPLRREEFIAETDDKAWRLFAPGLRHEYGTVYRSLHPTYPDVDTVDNLKRWADGRFLVGSVSTVAAQLRHYQSELGVTECLVRFQLPGVAEGAIADALAGFAETLSLL
jgi:acetyl-CoA C-acetyltransferase